MRSHNRQLDLVRHSDPAKVEAYKAAAETALRNPFETPDACERRRQYYLAEAARLEQARRGVR